MRSKRLRTLRLAPMVEADLRLLCWDMVVSFAKVENGSNTSTGIGGL